MGILPVKLDYRHPKAGSGLEVGSRPAHRSLFWALGGTEYRSFLGVMMSDVSLLLQIGWKNLWKAKAVWIFNLMLFIRMPRFDSENGLPFACLNLVGSTLKFIFDLISETGITYSAYQASNGASVTFQEASLAIKKYWIKVNLFLLLIIVILSPYICAYIFYFYSYNQYKQNSDIISIIYAGILPINAFSAMWYFPLIGIVAYDWGIRKSIATAWKLFTLNFLPLAITGVIITSMAWVINVIVGMVAILVQSNLDISSLTRLNYIIPYLSLADSPLFQLMNTIVQVLVSSYFALVFTAAFVKYSGADRPTTK